MNVIDAVALAVFVAIALVALMVVWTDCRRDVEKRQRLARARPRGQT